MIPKKHLFWFFLSAILILGIFLRTYNHRDWLVFQLDQSRDSKIIQKAVDNGPGELPLLGPRAGGTSSDSTIYLGPVFYYFQYISASIFGNRPNILAWPDLLFSILAIPLFYYFVRKYFSIILSLGLTLLSSSSLFLIVYGRFAWNPNSIPFFMLLFLVGLLNFQSKKKRYFWIFLATFAMSIIIQLHFIAFFLTPLIFLIFIILNFKKIDFKIILIIVAVFSLVNMPVFLSEYQNKGENTKNILSETFSRTEVSEDGDFLKKGFESIQKVSFYNWISISSNQELDEVDLKIKKTGELSVDCNKKCLSYFPSSFLAVLLSILGFLLLINNSWKEKDRVKKDFLILNLISIISSLIIITPIIKGEHPRFFLVTTIFAFVIFGLLLDFIEKKFKKKIGLVSILIIIFLIFLHSLSNVKIYFEDKNDLSNLKNVIEKRDLISPGGENVTLLQLEKTIEFIEEDATKNKKNSIVFTADNYYARSINYLINQRNNVLVESYSKLSSFDPPFIYNDVYCISRTNSSAPFNEEVTDVYRVLSKKEAGSLTVYQLFKKELK